MKVILTLPVLEKLIGNDNELEVEIRKCIVHEFSKRHLSAVATAIYGDIEKNKQEVMRQVFEQMSVTKIADWGNTRFTLTSDAQLLIKKAVQSAITEEVDRTVKEAWLEMKPQIVSALKACYDREALKAIREQVKADMLAALKDPK